MHDAITRSTFAYAAVLFAVLFAPQVGLPHHGSGGYLPSLFPDGAAFAGTLAILFLAVRHGMAGHTDSQFARGFARGTAVACMSAVLYAIGIAVIGPGIFSDRAFTWIVVVLGAVTIAVVGAAASALIAFAILRHARPRGRAA
jgi:hypothetical protein